jgi:hypothetical protein
MIESKFSRWRLGAAEIGGDGLGWSRRVAGDDANARVKAERVVQFAVGRQPGVRRDDRTAKLSVSRRSKSSLGASPSDSPPGFAAPSAFKPA